MAATLNGTNQFFSCLSAVITAYPATLACWFNPTNNVAAYYTAAVYNSGTELAGWRTRAAGDQGGTPVRAATGDGTTNSAVNTGVAFSTNTWQNMMFVLTSATSRNIYINGSNSGADAVNITPAGLNRTYIGANRASGADSNFFPGQIAHWAAWNIAMPAQGIALFGVQRWSPWNVQRQALTAYFPFFTNANDMTGNFTLTANNSPTFSADPGLRFYLGNSYQGGF